MGAISSADGPLAVFTGGGRGAVLLVWLAVINLVTFAVYGIDKAKAKRGACRKRRCSCCRCWAAAWAHCWG